MIASSASRLERIERIHSLDVCHGRGAVLCVLSKGLFTTESFAKYVYKAANGRRLICI